MSKPREIEQAVHCQLFACSNPQCRSWHLWLFDENDEPYAEVVLPEGIIEELRKHYIPPEPKS